MKIVHLSTQDFGGAGKAAYRLHKGFQMIGIDSILVVMDKQSGDPSVKVIPDYKLTSVSYCNTMETYTSTRMKLMWKHWGEMLKEYRNRPEGLEIFTDSSSDVKLNLIKEILDADIINLHWVAGMINFEDIPASFRVKKIVWTLHDMNAFTGGCHYSSGCSKYLSSCGACPQLGSSILNDISKETFELKNKVYNNFEVNIVAPSKWLCNEAKKSSLFSKYDVKVIPYGLPLDTFKPEKKSEARKWANVPEYTKVILFGADSLANNRKGLKYLIKALNLFNADEAENILLLTFGYSTIDLKDLKYNVKNLGVITDERILSVVYAIADVFIIPSLEDNLPNTVLESLACGTPVVGFNIGGIPDMIKHKINGYLAKEKDYVDLAEGIRWVIENNKGNTLSINGLQKVYKEYSLEKQAQNYLQLYRKLMGEKFPELSGIGIDKNELFFAPAGDNKLEINISNSSQNKFEGKDNINLNELVERSSAPVNHLISSKDFLNLKSYLINKFKIKKVPDDPNGMISINGIHGYLTFNDIVTLYSYAFKIPVGGTIVEVGSFMGLSAFIFANALIDSNNLNAKIYCIDLWNSWRNYNYDVFQNNIINNSIGNLVVNLRGDSLSKSFEINQKSADLVFIDADHSYDGCYNDLLAYFPKLKSNGILLGHDYGSKVFKVTEAVTDFIKKYNLKQNFESPFQGSSICKIVNKSSLSFSIITPSFNQGKYIQQTIDSIKNQNYLSLEHIIIDGASTDGTVDILKNTKHIRWISEPDMGQSDAVNKGFKIATGEIIGWLNSDDWYEPGIIEKVNRFFIDNPNKNIVMGDCNLVDENDKIFDRVINVERGFEELKNYRVSRSIPTQPAIFFRRRLLDEHGPLDTNLKYAMDYDLWMRFSKRNRFFHINQIFANYRFHKDAKIGDLNWEKMYPECEMVKQRYIEKEPLVSVIIPCYNYGRYLAEAVDSVINQTYTNFEIVIVNDGSTDNTTEIADNLIKKYSGYSITLLNQENSGQPAVARNKGIGISKGSFILPLDADDKLPFDALENYINAALKGDSDEVVVYGWMQKFNLSSDLWKTSPFNPNKLLRKTTIPSSSFFHRSVWEKNGGYSLNVKGYEDWDFWISASEIKTPFININKITSLYRETQEPSLQDLGRKNHEWNVANIVSNHPNLYEPEEVLWAAQYLNENSVPPVSGNIYGSKEKFPLAVSLMIVNYPELYQEKEVGWAISYLQHSNYRFFKGIQSENIPRFTIISVNYNTKEWIKLLIEKVREFTGVPYEFIIIDNGSSDGSVEYLEKQKDIILLKNDMNIGHGPALDYGFSFIRTRYAIVIDSDAHPIRADWINKLLSSLDNNCLVSGIHHHRNYVHPACMALEVKTFYKYKLTFKPNWPKDNDINKLGNTNWDAGEYISVKILEDGKKINLIPLSKRNSNTIVGSEYGGIIYHNFYATRLKTNGQNNFDGIERNNIEKYTKEHFDNLKSESSCVESLNEETRNKFRLSVIITTYNRIELLEKVLEAFVNQTASKDQFEVIVVDDGSNPKAESCVNNFKNNLIINYIYHQNKGLAFSRNKGIENANYEIIAFADDDDIPSPDYVKEHLYSHQKYPGKNVAVLGNLEWHSSVQITPFMDYITRINGDYFSFENLITGQFYDAWKWWGGLISCKKELLKDYNPVFDETFSFGYEDTDLAVRMLNNDIKVFYNSNAKSYIMKEIGFDEFLTRNIKQGKSLYLLEKKYCELVRNRYFTAGAWDELEILEINLGEYKNKISALENSLSRLPLPEQIIYLNNNTDVNKVLYKLYSLCIRGYLLKGYNESYRQDKIKFNLNEAGNKKFNIGLHSQTLHRNDSVVAGSEITTKGLKKAFEKYDNVEKVVRYGTNTYTEVNEKLDLVIIEGWDPDVPFFIEEVKKKNNDAVIFFWNLSFLGLENLSSLPVNGFLTNSEKMTGILSPYAPVKKVLLAADTDELYPVDKIKKYDYDVVYLGMYHPHKSDEIISRMLMEACDFNFAIYGNGWDSHPHLKKYWKGKLPNGEINSLYSSAKIVIGTTEDRQRDAGMINNRVFEALACGSTFVSEYFPELESTFGDLIYYSKKKNDTRNIISDILNNKLKRKSPAEIHEFIVKNHTYDERVKDIFDFYFEIVNKKSTEVQNFNDEKVSELESDPFVSVCIPAYNRSNYLKDSIKSALNQKYDNYEIIIVDDGSTDNTREVVSSFSSKKINYIKIEHSGAPVARNKAIENSKGEFILWLDSDDVLEENTMQLYGEKLKSLPDADILYGNLAVTDCSLNTKRIIEYEDWNGRNNELISRLFFESPVPHPAIFIKKEIYKKAGNYDVSFKRAHDYEWWTRAASFAKFGKINSVVCKWRWHNTNMSAGSVGIDTSFEEQVLKKMLSRFTLENLFPTLNWHFNPNEEVKAAAYLNIAKRFMELNRKSAALEYLQKSYDLHPDVNILRIINQLNETYNKYLSKDKLRVLLVVHNFPPYWYAGVENYTYSLAKSFIKVGLDVSVLYPQTEQDLKEPFIEQDVYDGIKVIRLMLKEDHNPVNQVINEDAEKLFAGVLDEGNYNIVHFHHLIGLPFSLVDTAKAKAVKVAVTLHDFWTVCLKTHLFREEDNKICSGPESVSKCIKCLAENLPDKEKETYEKYLNLRKTAAGNLLNKADLLVAPSHFVSEKFKSFGYNRDIKVIPLGINKIKKINAKGRKKIVFGYVGTINKLKNVELLINSFSGCKGNMVLKIFGDGDGNVINDIKKMIPNDKRISYRGPYKPSDLPKIFSQIDFLIVPSLIESYSLVVREALSAGIPVVASNVGGIPEIIENDVNGLLFNPGSKEELQSIIKILSKDNSLIKKLRKGIKPVKGINEESKELIDEYKKITEKKQINISIIIPVFNKVDYTKKCIGSIYLNTPGSLNFEVLVVDNASTDGTKEYLEEQNVLHENLFVISNEKNEGFAKANNQAVQRAKGSYLMFLNNDTEVQKGWLESLLNTIESDDSIGAVGSKLIYPDGTIQHAGVIIVDNPKEENSLVASHVFVNQPSDFPLANEIRTYQSLTAASLLIKKNIFEKVRGFDENYWNGYEDVDLCFKIGELGYSLVYQPGSIVLHHESKSGPERFSKVAHNVELLNKKWLNKIKADFTIDENNKLKPVNTKKIQNYKLNNRDNTKVSIIALTYNQLDYTKVFIQSLYQFTKVPFELIIVDNNSNQDTIDLLKELEKSDYSIKVIFNNKNLGFPKGINQAIKAASGNYILIANNDIVVTKGWIERMLKIAESDPKIGLVGPISNLVSGRQLDENSQYRTMEEMHNYAAEVKQKNKGEILEFPRVAFLCTLIKKEVIEKIGGLDERFSPGNFEDDDYCLRAQKAGFKTVIVKDVFIHHFGSKSFTAEGLEKYKTILEKNQKIFIDKWGATPEEIWLKGKQTKGRKVMFTLNKNEFTENLERALSLIEEKEYDVAMDYLNNSVELYDKFDHEDSDPDLANLLNLAGNVSLIKGNLKTAQKYFEHALNEDKNSSHACTGLGEVLFTSKNYLAAKTMYEWGVKNNPENKAAIEGLSKVNKILNLPEDDNSLMKSDEETDSPYQETENIESETDRLINEAYEMFNEKKFNESLNKLNKAEKIFNGQLRNPVNPDFAASFYNMKGFNYLGLNDIDNAKACFQKALEINPDSSQAYAGLGEILFLNEYDEQAKVMFEKAIKNNPGNLFAINGLEKINRILIDNNSSCGSRIQSDDKLKIRHRDDFGKLFNQLELLGKGAEIGVQAGLYSQTLRNTWKGEELYLIDRWKYDPDYKDIANVSDEKQIKLYLSVVDKFANDDSIQVIKKDSIEASKQFPDEFFDWIYLDADHSYAGCMNDLEAWYPKLKKGGIFAGHDYLDGEFACGSFRVKSAVDKFIKDKIVNLITTDEEMGKSWYFVKPGSFDMEQKTNGEDLLLNVNDSQKLQTVLNEILEASYELFSLKHFEEAIDSLNKSEELFYSKNNKELISAFENMKGFNYLGLNDNRNARKSFEIALNINPESSQACAGLGELFYLEGKDKEAKTMYEYAVKNNPENQYATNGLEKVNKNLALPDDHNSLLQNK